MHSYKRKGNNIRCTESTACPKRNQTQTFESSFTQSCYYNIKNSRSVSTRNIITPFKTHSRSLFSLLTLCIAYITYMYMVLTLYIFISDHFIALKINFRYKEITNKQILLITNNIQNTILTT